MNKGLGATTGAVMILATGALLRPVPTQSAVPSPAPAASLSRSAVSQVEGEGPWKASCQYWAPVRVPQENGTGKSAEFAVSVTKTGGKVDSRLEVSTEKDSAQCGGVADPWGIPAVLPDGQHRPEITAIIAAVPDPERGHLQLDFDRTLDALMQAASDNGYVGSYFWLPWKNSEDREANTSTNLAAKTEETAEKHKQPGLIVLKYGKAEGTDRGLSFRRVIYLFLVAATPTQGVNGEQLRNALADEVRLRRENGATLSMRDAGRQPEKAGAESEQPRSAEMDLLLFNYSGAAASFREGLYAAIAETDARFRLFPEGTRGLVSIAGATSTKLVSDLLNGSFQPKGESQQTTIQFHSFEESTGIEEREVTKLFQDEGQSCDRIALLFEDGTIFGSDASDHSTENTAPKPREGQPAENLILKPCNKKQPLVLKFPRDISLLRNATAEKGDKNQVASDASISPYLRFSLGDSNAEDSIPHFSSNDTPLSQEAQLMAVGRQLVRSHIRTIAISASNILDKVFLAQFLHRACPDARLIFLGGGDLLLEREIESAQYVGAISVSPYSLVNLDLDEAKPQLRRAFASAQSEALYNAASFTFRDFRDRDTDYPYLAGYPKRRFPDVLQPSLWATAVGRDGYYPLGILEACASDSEPTLPDVHREQGNGSVPTTVCTSSPRAIPPAPFDRTMRVYPSTVWFALCIVIFLLSTAHTAVLLTANFWSAFTRDLSVDNGDMPRRRAIYIHIATVMLFCMAFVVVYPLFSVARYTAWDAAALLWAVLTLAAASVALVTTLRRIWPHIHFVIHDQIHPERRDRCEGVSKEELVRRTDLYTVIHVVASIALLTVPVLWIVICRADETIGTQTFAGFFFSFRCLHPESGVSPLPPILLLLSGWYLWGFFQTLRLRFSINARPQLPCAIHADTAYPLYVSEERLSRSEATQSSCLYRNITCLLITREIVRRFLRPVGKTLDGFLIAGYFALFFVVVVLVHVQSLDHFLWDVHSLPTFYEFLIRALLFPLMVIALTGWIRVLFIWNSFRRGLLEPLEQLPIRFAFTRLKGVAWMTMLRQGGLEEYWRDMARCTESMRQMIHNQDLESSMKAKHPLHWTALQDCNLRVEGHIRDLLQLVADDAPNRRSTDGKLRKRSREFLVGNDIPDPDHRDELNLIAAIECGYARFCELLLEFLLIPYWNEERTGFVEGEPTEMMPIKAKRGSPDYEEALELHADPQQRGEEFIRFAEEFLALRYVSLIRAVLINLRYTMIFVSTAFALAILAWNSYPFRPRYWVDWMFTGILITLGSGVVWVFAQMYRNPILSRITDTSANELGVEFYLRLATFGAVPLLTWLASQFPGVGTSLYHLLMPGLEVVK